MHNFNKLYSSKFKKPFKPTHMSTLKKVKVKIPPEKFEKVSML